MRLTTHFKIVPSLRRSGAELLRRPVCFHGIQRDDLACPTYRYKHSAQNLLLVHTLFTVYLRCKDNILHDYSFKCTRKKRETEKFYLFVWKKSLCLEDCLVTTIKRNSETNYTARTSPSHPPPSQCHKAMLFLDITETGPTYDTTYALLINCSVKISTANYGYPSTLGCKLHFPTKDKSSSSSFPSPPPPPSFSSLIPLLPPPPPEHPFYSLGKL